MCCWDFFKKQQGFRQKIFYKTYIWEFFFLDEDKRSMHHAGNNSSSSDRYSCKKISDKTPCAFQLLAHKTHNHSFSCFFVLGILQVLLELLRVSKNHPSDHYRPCCLLLDVSVPDFVAHYTIIVVARMSSVVYKIIKSACITYSDHHIR